MPSNKKELVEIAKIIFSDSKVEEYDDYLVVLESESTKESRLPSVDVTGVTISMLKKRPEELDPQSLNVLLEYYGKIDL